MGKVRRRRESGLHFGSVVDRGEGERGAAQIRGRRSRNGGRPIRDHGRGGLGVRAKHRTYYRVGVGLGPV
jgi:hypothetical protein